MNLHPYSNSNFTKTHFKGEVYLVTPVLRLSLDGKPSKLWEFSHNDAWLNWSVCGQETFQPFFGGAQTGKKNTLYDLNTFNPFEQILYKRYDSCWDKHSSKNCFIRGVRTFFPAIQLCLNKNWISFHILEATIMQQGTENGWNLIITS